MEKKAISSSEMHTSLAPISHSLVVAYVEKFIKQ